MAKKLIAILAIVVMVFSLAGCKEEVKPEPKVEAPTRKITMVTDTGGINDKSFNQSAWEGLQTLKDAHPDVTFDYVLSTAVSEYAANIRTAVDNGSELTWAVGYMLADAMAEVAESMPDKKFGLIDVTFLEADNLVQVGFKEQEGGFLVGLVAGMTSKSNKFGFVGGMSGDLIKRFEVGYRAGVHTVKPDISQDDIMIAYTESWDDSQKGKEIAGVMFDDGADVIFHAAGYAGNGIFDAAKERGTGPEGFWTIGVDRDQIESAPDNMLTSMMKQVGNAMASITEEYLTNGTFNGGEILNLGLKEDAVGLAPSSKDTIPAEIYDEVMALVEEYTAKIVSGELVLPHNEETLQAYIAGLKK